MTNRFEKFGSAEFFHLSGMYGLTSPPSGFDGRTITILTSVASMPSTFSELEIPLA
jgi:hypothetical protein